MSGQRQVLVIEDDQEIRASMSLRLRAAGYGVFHATDGAAGLNQVGSIPIDAIILDLQLPDVDGFEVLRNLQAVAGRDIPVIVLSAHASRTARRESLALGARCFMEKPFQSAALLAVMKQLTAETRGAPSKEHTDVGSPQA